MPREFERCVRRSGRIRRKSLPGDRYINICLAPGASKKAGKGGAVTGEVHKKKK